MSSLTAKTCIRLRAVVLAGLQLASAPLTAAGAAAGEAADAHPWRPMLELQIREANGCHVVEILHARELKIGSHVGTEGRLRCHDGREYDFTRAAPHQRFTFRLCQPAVC